MLLEVGCKGLHLDETGNRYGEEAEGSGDGVAVFGDETEGAGCLAAIEGREFEYIGVDLHWEDKEGRRRVRGHDGSGSGARTSAR